jgi:hypothetical protein
MMNKMLDKELNWGKIVEKNNLGNIMLPKKILDSLINETETTSASPPTHVLVIFSPKPRALKIDIFPLESKDVIKIQLKLTDFSIRTIEQLREITKELHLPDYLYMSGVCVEKQFCLHESYIEKEKLTVSIDSIRERFMSIDSVTDVQIYQVE